MQLLDNGIGVQVPQWVVNEKQAAGFSRVYYIISGDITYYDDTTVKKLVPGVMYVYPAHKPYRMEHDPEHPIECLWFHIDFFPYDIERLIEYEVSTDKNPTLYHIIKALMNEGKFFQNNDRLYTALAESLAMLIVKHPSVKNADSHLAEILNYIRGNIFSPALNVTSISEHFGYTTAHFIRLFKLGMNTTPYKYITMLRMNAASKHLIEGANVTYTAAFCGYSDIKTFARVFKKSFGVPPSEYVRYYYPKA